MRRRARAFTLFEAALAMALVGIVAIAAIGLYAAVIRVFSNTRKTVALTDRSQAVIDYLTHELRSVGGNGIPASAALFVEDGCNARGDPVLGFPDCGDAAAPVERRPPIAGKADRLTTFTALQGVPPCPITAISGPMVDGEGTASFVTRNPNTGANVCCFTTGSGSAPFMRTVILMKDGFFRPALLTNNTGTCTFKWQDIVPPSMRTLPPSSNVPAPTMSNTFLQGLAVLVDFRTIYMDPSSHDLVMHMDQTFTDATLNGYGARPTVAGERLRILDGVYDFQVALGYDLDYNGDVTEVPGGGSDEWLYNAPSETLATAFTDPFDATRLRLVRIEALVGLPTEGPSGGASVSSPARDPNSISVPHVALRAVGARLAPRNVDLPTFN